MPQIRRRPAVAVVPVALAAFAAPASAHAPVTHRTPAPNATAKNVKSVSVTFGEAVVTGKITVTSNGKTVATKSSGLNAKKTVLKATFAKALAKGSYKVSWRVKADDGDSQTGTWSFKAA